MVWNNTSYNYGGVCCKEENRNYSRFGGSCDVDWGRWGLEDPVMLIGVDGVG